MEDINKAKLAAVNECVKSSVLIGTVDVISDDDIIIVDMLEECAGELVKDRTDLVGFPLSEAGIPHKEIATWIVHDRESQRLQMPVEFELKTSSFATEQHPVFHAIVAHEGGNRFSFVLLNTLLKQQNNHFGGELGAVYEQTFKQLMDEKIEKYKACMAFSAVKKGNKELF